PRAPRRALHYPSLDATAPSVLCRLSLHDALPISVEFGRAVAPEPEPAAPAGFAMEPLEPGSGVEEARPAWDMPTRPLPLFPQPEADAKEPTESAPEEEQPEPLTAFLTPEPEEPAESEDPEEAHLREVYEQFLQVRQQCGESSAGISYERFAAKLRATRAQLMERYRSEEHTSELQSRENLVCRLLLEKK